MVSLLSRAFPSRAQAALTTCVGRKSLRYSAQVRTLVLGFHGDLCLAWRWVTLLTGEGGLGVEGWVQILHSRLFGTICFCFSGTQISCFSPSSFSWRQAAFVDSYCWAAVQQGSLQGDSGRLPLWLHKVTADTWESHLFALSMWERGPERPRLSTATHRLGPA